MVKPEPQTAEELSKELGYHIRTIRDIAKEQIKKGEWTETTKIIYIPKVVKAYYRKER